MSKSYGPYIVLHSTSRVRLGKPSNLTWPRRMITRLVWRDGTLCHWCKLEVDMLATSTSDLSPTVEHLTRKCEGGTNHMDNLALAHKKCNNERQH